MGTIQSMADLQLLLFGVRDTRAFHQANLRTNRAHYSALPWLGIDAVCAVQRSGARVYFNTHVDLTVQVRYVILSLLPRFRGPTMGLHARAGLQRLLHLCPPLCCSHVQGGRVVRAKYGVIGTADLVDDLRNWTALFASGRMHKPVRDCAD